MSRSRIPPVKDVNAVKAVNRRKFLKGAALGAAATAAAAVPVSASAPPQAEPARPASPAQGPPPAGVRAAESQALETAGVMTIDRPGSDFMVDVLKSLGLEYVCANPGSSFRSLHESIVNYGGNKSPELVTCCHEEASVAMGHGYAKVEGKPIAAMLHGPVGLQHAAMAIYNAYCDRVPVYLIVGNSLDAVTRRPGVEWLHSAHDVVAMVRDFVKWDDTPVSLEHWAESSVRAYKIAMTPPMMPVAVVADLDLQEQSAKPGVRVPKLPETGPPQGDTAMVAEAARLLVDAENPLIVVDRAARTPAGMRLLVELAEVLQCPVADQYGRLNFPNRHPLNHSERMRALVAQADVIVGIELTDFWGVVHTFRDQAERVGRVSTKPGAKLVSLTATDLYAKGNFQDIERYPEVDLAIAGDGEATLPWLIEAAKKLITPDRRRALDARGARLADTRQQMLAATRAAAAEGWDASPISTARLSAELWGQIRNDDWSLVSETSFVSNWPLRLWEFSKYSQYIGGQGGYGEGYGAPAAVGAALANKKYGRLSVSIQRDGDLMYSPGVLWTAAHHRIPLLSVMHNNRAYHQETMHLQRMTNRHQRGVTQAAIGTTLDDPNIDYARLAQSLGMHAEGPITNPAELGPAIGRALAVVRQGQPALVDVVTQPR